MAWLIALPWVVRFAESARGFGRVANLMDASHDHKPEGFPALTVIVPARNEAAAIADCLESLVAQDYTNLRIIAVNDRSTDTTGAIMDEIAARHPGRVETLHITELPAGWLGKTHAMATAARQAIATHRPDYLLFTDGDIFFAPEILRRSLAEAQSSKADHFVTLPTTIIRSPGEAMLLAFLQVMSLFAVRPWKVSDPKSRDALGVGAFNLIRTEVYTALGGFDATPMEILEDLTLGRRAKAAGYRQVVAGAPGAVCVHWAPGLIGVLHGMTKNLFAVFRFRPELLWAGVLGLAAFWILPVVFLFFSATRVPAMLTLAAMAGLYWLVGRRSLISPVWALAGPMAAALVVYSMLRSMVVTLRQGGVTWRGTFYPLGTLRRGLTDR